MLFVPYYLHGIWGLGVFEREREREIWNHEKEFPHSILLIHISPQCTETLLSSVLPDLYMWIWMWSRYLVCVSILHVHLHHIPSDIQHPGTRIKSTHFNIIYFSSYVYVPEMHIIIIQTFQPRVPKSQSQSDEMVGGRRWTTLNLLP